MEPYPRCSAIVLHTGQHEGNCPREVTCSCCRARPCPTPEPTFAPTISQPPSISLAPTVDRQEIYEVLANITDLATLEDATTPQGRALRWLLREDGRHLQPNDPTLIQRYVMVVLYFSTNGDDWHQCFASSTPSDCGGRESYYREYYQPFLSEASECFWGVWDGNACDRDNGLIRIIQIPRNNLVGSLPMELAALPELRHVDVSSNTIHGILPQVWPPKLESLQLSNNRISGPLMGEFPTSLRHLDLEENILNGTVDNLIVALNRTKVSYLNLRGNRLTGSIPSTLADLSFRDTILWQVNFANNKLAGAMPSVVCDAKRKEKIGSIIVGKDSKQIVSLLFFLSKVTHKSSPFRVRSQIAHLMGSSVPVATVAVRQCQQHQCQPHCQQSAALQVCLLRHRSHHQLAQVLRRLQLQLIYPHRLPQQIRAPLALVFPSLPQ